MYCFIGGACLAAPQPTTRRRACAHSASAKERDDKQWIAALARPLAGTAQRRRLSQRLSSAGRHAPEALDRFLLVKLAVFLVASLFGCWFVEVDLRAPLANPLALGKLLLLLYAAVRLPDWRLGERIRVRQQHRISVPQMVDLLTVCADAGLSLEDALSRVAAEIAPHAPELAAELRQTASELIVMPDRAERSSAWAHAATSRISNTWPMC